MKESAPRVAQDREKSASVSTPEGPVQIELHTWEGIKDLPDTHPIKKLGIIDPHASPRSGEKDGVIFINDVFKENESAPDVLHGAFNVPHTLVSTQFGSCVFLASVARGRASLAHVASIKRASRDPDEYLKQWGDTITHMRADASPDNPATFFFGGGMRGEGRDVTRKLLAGLLREKEGNALYDISGKTDAGAGTTTVIVMPQESRILVIRSAVAAGQDVPISDILQEKIDSEAVKRFLNTLA